MTVYVAFRSVPDYTAGAPALHSIHITLRGAIEALYPDKPEWWDFRRSSNDEWHGPDGYGLVRLMEVQK